MLVKLTSKMKETLKLRGVESFHGTDFTNISDEAVLEPPCSIKWMQIENEFSLGAFSYAVRGYFSAVNIKRYVSIGEEVQIGRSNHAMDWVSTSPFFYLRERLFNIGGEFAGSAEYANYAAPIRHRVSTGFKPIEIGNDVWIGHGAFVLPGVKIGDGAIVGAMAVVTRDVPPFGIVAGNPATLKRMRLPEAQAQDLLERRWWRYAPWQLTEVDFTQPDKAADQLRKIEETETPYAPQPVRVRDLV